MGRVARFVIWICSKFNRVEIVQIIYGLQEVLAERNPEVKPKDDFKEKHPSYRYFYVDPLPPLRKQPQRSLNPLPSTGRICSKTMSENTVTPSSLSSHEKASRSLSSTDASIAMPQLTTSTTTMAKDGPKFAARSVAIFFQTQKRHHPSRKARYFCPHCHKALYRWKEQPLLTIYKCGNDHCPAFLKALNKLNASEKQLQKKKLSQFKLRYQYREYHFQPSSLKHSAPDKPKINLDRIHYRSDILGLVLGPDRRAITNPRNRLLRKNRVSMRQWGTFY